jgi:hypothetical protein
VVKNEENYWTNVRTGVIQDTRDTTTVPTSVTCVPMSRWGSEGASSIAAVTSLLIAALVTVFAL